MIVDFSVNLLQSEEFLTVILMEQQAIKSIVN